MGYVKMHEREDSDTEDSALCRELVYESSCSMDNGTKREINFQS